MATGLLNTSIKPTYADNRAGILAGGGNKSISDATIRAFINQPGMTPEKALAATLSNNVSESQIANAMGWNPADVRNYTSGQGIDFTANQPAPAPVAPEPDKVQSKDIEQPKQVSFNPANITTYQVDPKTDTVQGQLQTITDDPNNPLNIAAETRAKQYSNKRGLLNSSIGSTATQQAVLDNALNIATPDATIYSNRKSQNQDAQNQGAMFNAQQQFLASQANADNAQKQQMFNSDALLRSDMFNSGNQADIYKFNAGNALDLTKSRENILSNEFIANLDTDTKTMIANLQARSQESGHAAQLFDTLMRATQTILSDPNMPPDAKQRGISQLTGQLEGVMSLFETMDTAGISEMLKFDDAVTGANGQQSTPAPVAGKSISDPTVSILPDGSAKPLQNPTGFIIPKERVQAIQNFNAKKGTSFDPGKLVALDEVKDMPFNKRLELYDPLPLYDKLGQLKPDTALFHRV